MSPPFHHIRLVRGVQVPHAAVKLGTHPGKFSDTKVDVPSSKTSLGSAQHLASKRRFVGSMSREFDVRAQDVSSSGEEYVPLQLFAFLEGWGGVGDSHLHFVLDFAHLSHSYGYLALLIVLLQLLMDGTNACQSFLCGVQTHTR